MLVKRITMIILVVFSAGLLAACGGSAEERRTVPSATVPPRATAVTENAAWTPVTETFDGVAMVQVPAGCFMMGNEAGRRDERPAHAICFDAPFWIDRTEVTNAQYGSPGAFEGDDVARGNLTWFEARDHCLSRGARLPTEAEWEYAARGPDNLIYPWGNELVEENLVFERNSNNTIAPVGSRPAGVSWVGALDMAGNVWEWVSSIYRPYPYTARDGREDLDDSTSSRVYRGGIGSYIDFAASAPIRFQGVPDTRDWFIGFRCARDAGE